MVDLARDVDEYFAQLDTIEEILIGGKTEAQIAELTILLKAVVDKPEGPAHDEAFARMLERLGQIDHENQASRLSA